MVRYLLRFSYLGTKYRGLQVQPQYPNETIQGAIEMALESLEPLNQPSTHASSRTDKGVHALMNAVTVNLEHKVPGETFQPHIVTSRLNNYFRENDHDIRIIKTCVVPDAFNVRYHAKWRSYVYRLAILKPEISSLNMFGNYDQFLPITEINRCHVIPNSLDISKVQEGLKYFIGTHNFTSFTKGLIREPWKDPIRTIYEFQFQPSINQGYILEPEYKNINMWEFYVRARSFLHYQVRKMIAVLLSAGFGYHTVDDIKIMIQQPGVNMHKTAALPPPYGLYLTEIYFDSKDFEVPNKDEDDVT